MASRPGPVSSSAAGLPALVPQGRHAGKPNLPLTRPCMIAGAASKSHFNLVSPTVSKVHAALIKTDVGVYIRDLASRTHVFVNGKQTAESLLAHGDYVAIGAFTFQFRYRGQSLSLPKAAPDASIAVDRERIPIPFEGRTLLIGRRAGCDIHLIEAAVSNCHALIFEQNGTRWIRDLHSRTGTFVNGTPIHQKQLEIDDDIRVGDTSMRYVATPSTTAHIDELEDLVGTAKLGSDDSVHRKLEPFGSVVVPPDLRQPEPVKPTPTVAVPPAKKIPAPAVAAELRPSAEPDEYDLAPPAPVTIPTKVTRVPPVPMPAETLESEPQLKEQFASEAELDGASPDDLPGLLPRDEAEQPVEASHLVSTNEELPPADADLAIPQTADAAGTVAFDASQVADEVVPPTTSSTEAAAASTRDESLHELEIPVAEPVGEVDFDDLVADELQSDQASEPITPIEVEASHESAAPVEARVEASADAELDSHLPIELAPPVPHVDFDDLIADEIHPDQRTFDRAADAEAAVYENLGSLNGSQLREGALDELQPVTPEMVEQTIDAAHFESPAPIPIAEAAPELPVELELPAPEDPAVHIPEPAAHSAEADFDDLIADELQPVTPEVVEQTIDAEHFESPVAIPIAEAAPEPAAELELSSPEDPAVHIPEPTAHSAEADFDALITDELQTAAVSEVVESTIDPSSISGAAEHDLFAVEEGNSPSIGAAVPESPEQQVDLSPPPATAEVGTAGKSGGISIFDENSPAEASPAAVGESGGASTWSELALGSEEFANPADEPHFEEEQLLDDELREATAAAASDEHPAIEPVEPIAPERPPKDESAVEEPSAIERVGAIAASIPRAEPPVLSTASIAASPKPTLKDRLRSLLGRKKPGGATMLASSEESDTDATVDVALPEHDAMPMSTSAPDLLDDALSVGAPPDTDVVIEPTDPTPESAQTLATALPSPGDPSSQSEIIDAAALTDSSFARAVDEFISSSPAPIVEALPASAEIEPPQVEVPSVAAVSSLAEAKLDDLEIELSEVDASDGNAVQPRSDDDTHEILSGSDAVSSPKDANGAPATGAPTHTSEEHSPKGNGSPSPPAVQATSVVIPKVVTRAANADLFVQSTTPARSGSRFSFWPFGRKRSDPAGPSTSSILSSGSHGSDPVVDLTASDPSISISSSSDFDLAPAPHVTATTVSSKSARTGAGDIVDQIASDDVLDSALELDAPDDAESDNLEPVNIELSDAPSSGATPGWDSPSGIEGLELEPQTASAVAALPEPPPAALEIDDLEQELFIDEWISDSPADAPELELSPGAPLPQTDEAVLHVAAPALDLPPQPVSESPAFAAPEIDSGVTLSTHLAAAPVDALEVSEPAPVVIEPFATEFHSSAEIALPVSGTPPIVIETAPSAFHPTEQIPLSVPPVTASQETFAPSAQISVLPFEGMISAALPAQAIEFASDAETSAVTDEQAAVEPFVLEQDVVDSSTIAALDRSSVVEDASESELPFLDLDSSDAPPLAVNAAELASVAAATREILADATPSPRPRSPKRAVAPPEIPIPEDFELPPPEETGAGAPTVAGSVDEPVAEVDFATDLPPAPPPPAQPDQPISFEAPPIEEMATETSSPSPIPTFEEPIAFQPPDAGDLPAATPPTQVSASPVNPFLGMGRDLGTFLGGMPLDLSRPLAAPPSVFGQPSLGSNPVTAAPEVAADIVVAPDSRGTDDSEESIGHYLSKMNAEEARQDLFESSPDSLDALPDSMGTISDVVEVLGEESDAPGAHGTSHAGPIPSGNQPQQLFTLSESSPQSPAKPNPGTPSPRKSPAHLPPRPRLSNRSLATSPFDFGSQPGADTAIPPFAGGSITSGQITTEFDGLPMARPREAEAFGKARTKGEAFIPPADPGRRGAAMLTTLSASPPDAFSPRVRSDAEIPRRPRGVGVPPLDRRGARPSDQAAAAVAPPRRSAPSPSPQFDGLPPMPPPAPLDLHLRVVLPIILALALATAAGIWYFYHVSGSAEGRLRFNNLENLGPSDKRDFELAEQQLLRRADVRDFARRLFEARNPGKVGAGFLSPAIAADNKAYESLVSAAAFAPNTNQFLLTAAGRDPTGDARRLAALIQSLYRENQRLADDSASARRAYLQSRDAAESTSAQINLLTPILQEEQAAAANLESAQQALEQDKTKSAALWQAWNDAARNLHAAQAEADQLEVAIPSAGGPGAASSPQKNSVESDSQIQELSAQLAAATESLTQSRVTHSAAADAANQALDQALTNFRARIDQAQGSLKDGSQLSRYFIAAQQTQDTIRQLNADLVERQKAEQQRLADLRRVLAEKQETRLKAAWAGDSQLQEMEQDLSVAEHRYNAAVGSGLDADAATLKAEVESIKNKMDARRDLIGTGDIYADEVKSLQQFIDDSLKGMETERTRADARMGDTLKSLSDLAPEMEKLPADQRALEESLKKQLDEINNARQLQAKAVAAANPEADAAVKKLEGSITELQAKIDARRKQIAEDSHKQLTAQQAQERAAALEKAKAALTAAQMEEADTSASVRANKRQTDEAYSKVEALRAKAANLTTDTVRLSALQAQLPEQKSQSERLLGVWQRIPVPEAPGEDSASATVVDDPRLQWILLSMLGYAMLTAGFLAMWGVSHRRHHILLTQPGDTFDEPQNAAHPDYADTLEAGGAAATQVPDDD